MRESVKHARIDLAFISEGFHNIDVIYPNTQLVSKWNDSIQNESSRQSVLLDVDDI